MQATPKQRIFLYLLTLLFIWANGFAAPYQSLQNTPTTLDIAVALTAADMGNNESSSLTSALQLPGNDCHHSIYGAYPAEETFEEENLRKEGDELQFVFLPEFLILPQLSANEYPRSNSQHDDYRAELKQSTYLLDCTFLI